MAPPFCREQMALLNVLGQSIEHQASELSEIEIPWPAESIALATAFESSRAKSNASPWLSSTPFGPHLDDAILLYRGIANGNGSYAITSSVSVAKTSEHLSLNFGVSAGCKFLNANVSGNYDQATLKNSDVRIPIQCHLLIFRHRLTFLPDIGLQDQYSSHLCGWGIAIQGCSPPLTFRHQHTQKHAQRT